MFSTLIHLPKEHQSYSVEGVIMEEDKKSFFLERENIAEMIPHTGPAQMLDRISYNTDRPNEMVGIKTIFVNELWIVGHFPSKPIFPGHCQIECANLVAAVLAKKVSNDLKSIPVVVSIDGIRFKKAIVPGDLLVITVNLYKQKKGMFFFSAVIQNESGEVFTTIEKIIGMAT